MSARSDPAVAAVVLLAALVLSTRARAETSGASPPPSGGDPAGGAPSSAPSQGPSSRPATPALDEPLRRALLTGCKDGVTELTALASSGGAGSDVAALVVRLCADIRAQRPAGTPALATASASAEPAVRRVDRGGRAQLVLGATVYGIWAGISVDVLADVKNDRILVLYPLLGMTAGLAGSLYVTRTGAISAGQAWAIITGFDYGTYNGLLWSAAANASTAKGVFGPALVTGVVGGIAGTFVATVADPPQGGVEMVRSGGLYGTSAALMSALLFSSDSPSSKAVFTTMAMGMDVGLVMGGLLAYRIPISRNRMLLIDAGTIAGLGFGLGGTWLITGSSGDGRRALGAGGLIGLGVGMATAIILTRDMDAHGDALAGASASVSVPALIARDQQGNWTVGSLALAPLPGPNGSGKALAGASLSLAGGVW